MSITACVPLEKEDAEESLDRFSTPLPKAERFERAKESKVIENTSPRVVPVSVLGEFISLFRKLPRFVMPHPNRSGPGSESVILREPLLKFS